MIKQSKSETQAHFVVQKAKALPFTKAKQTQFEKQLVCAFVSAGWSWNLMDDVEVRKLFNFLNPSAELPHRKKLAGPLLHQEVIQSESEIKLQNVSAFATVQCDGWKDISKFNLIAFMFTALCKV